ncbi:MAG: glycosyltransferase, partial [Angelakisella sp.]
MALFTETYLPHINGVVTHVKILKEGLEQLGHQVLIVTADSHTHRHYLEDGVLHCPALTSKKFYGYSIAKPISRARLKFVERFSPDIIHIHNEFGIGFSGMLCAKLLKVPLVYTLHTMYDDYIYYVAPKLLLNTTTQISHKYMKFFAVHANAVTGPSKKCEEYFRLT